MPNGVLNPQRFQKDYRAINTYYAAHGYTATEVIDHRLDADTKHLGEHILVYVILEPHISEIVVSGIKHTHEYVVLHQLVFKVGDIFNENDLNRSVINLDGLGIFQGVTYNAEAGTTAPGSIMVTMTVTEQSTGNASFGLAESSASGLTGFLTVTESNLFGTGRSLSLSFTYGGEKSYDLEYKIPYLDKHRTSFEIGIYDRITVRQAEGGSGISQDFVSHDAGMRVLLSRPLNWKSNTRIVLDISADNLRGTLTGNAAVFPPSVLIPILKQSNVRSISPSIVRDVRLGNPNRPFGGSYYSLGAQCAGLWGGVHFNKISGYASWYFIVKRDKKAAEKAQTNIQPAHWIYATRLMAGTSTGVPPFLNQFMAGGATTVRGYKEQRFPGQQMLVFNNELRIPVANIVDVVAFIDVGDAWGGIFAESLGDPNFHLHRGYGAGLRVNAPIIGPIRLDIGFDSQGHSELYFGVGPTF